jgi:hypothetical protein
VLGITGADYGNGTAGFSGPFADTMYTVAISNKTSGCYDGYRVVKAVDSLSIYSETAASVAEVDVTIIGTPA